MHKISNTIVSMGGIRTLLCWINFCPTDSVEKLDSLNHQPASTLPSFFP